MKGGAKRVSITIADKSTPIRDKVHSHERTTQYVIQHNSMSQILAGERKRRVFILLPPREGKDKSEMERKRENLNFACGEKEEHLLLLLFSDDH